MQQHSAQSNQHISGQMCDAEYNAVFTQANVHIIKEEKNLLTVTRDKDTGLWGVPL